MHKDAYVFQGFVARMQIATLTMPQETPKAKKHRPVKMFRYHLPNGIIVYVGGGNIFHP
jgi:hypothetical protein